MIRSSGERSRGTGVFGDFAFQASAANGHVSDGLRALPLFTSEGLMLVAWRAWPTIAFAPASPSSSRRPAA